MSTVSARTMSGMSVSKRLLSLGAAAIVGFASLMIVGVIENRRATQALVAETEVTALVAEVNELRIANLDMVLAAMDSIVDKAEKKVAPERIELMTKSLDFLEKDRQVVERLATMIGKPDLVKTYTSDIATLRKAVLTDLPALIEAGAPDDQFAAIDDAIDGSGEVMGTALATLAKEGHTLSQSLVSEAEALANESFYVQAALAAGFTLLMLAMFPIHLRSIRSGLNALTESMSRMAAGDYETPVSGKERGDEFGMIATVNDAFRNQLADARRLSDNLEEQRRLSDIERAAREAEKAETEAQLQAAVERLGSGLSALAHGDFTQVIREPFRSDLERLRHDFNQTAATLSKVISAVATNTTSIEANSRQMRVAADDLARRTEQQAASLEETSAALNQITITVRRASERAEEATQMVRGAKSSAEQSGKVVDQAMSAMGRIEDASSEIGKIINVIDEIAFQTNLLALNAGVEAARAGEAGKGFAVVAQEVRELAGRAAGAAKDIKTLVTKSGEEVRTGVQLVTATGEALTRIGDDVSRISETVIAIADSAREQTVGINEINAAIGQMDQMTQQNAAMVEETNAASHTLAQDTANLMRLVSDFKVSEMASGRPAAVEPRSAPAPIASPARGLVNKLAGAFTQQAAMPATKAAADQWEEF